LTARDDLAAAYERAVYRVDAPGGAFVIQVGQPSPEADGLLHERGLSSWVYITACNPGSERLPDEVNSARTAQLRELIAAYPYLEGEGGSPEGDWPAEHSFFVMGMEEERAAGLARRFGQAAYVAGDLGGVARLVWA
jgi:hypothetical protein